MELRSKQREHVNRPDCGVLSLETVPVIIETKQSALGFVFIVWKSLANLQETILLTHLFQIKILYFLEVLLELPSG